MTRLKNFFALSNDGTNNSGVVRTTEQAITALANLAADYIWDGTTTVLSADTSAVVVGEFIRLTADAQWFEVITVNANVSVIIKNPTGVTIPSGSGAGASDETTVPDSIPLPIGMWKIAAMGQPVLWRLGSTAITVGEGSFLGASDQEIIFIPANASLRYIVSAQGTANGEINVVPVEIREFPNGDLRL